jgi:hypothetical protein
MDRTVYLLVTVDLDDDDDRGAEEVRADVERQLAADLATVRLLAQGHDEMAPLRDPAARSRATQAAQERTAYLAAVITAMMRHDPAVQPYLSPLCPECNQIPEPEDGIHIVLGAAVVIGCEGYWVINPNVVGIAKPNWQPQD